MKWILYTHFFSIHINYHVKARLFMCFPASHTVFSSLTSKVVWSYQSMSAQFSDSSAQLPENHRDVNLQVLYVRVSGCAGQAKDSLFSPPCPPTQCPSPLWDSQTRAGQGVKGAHVSHCWLTTTAGAFRILLRVCGEATSSFPHNSLHSSY